jgi:hypothetical protein
MRAGGARFDKGAPTGILPGTGSLRLLLALAQRICGKHLGAGDFWISAFACGGLCGALGGGSGRRRGERGGIRH